jgi:anti-sigma factor ChrR (cupin superfamily)
MIERNSWDQAELVSAYALQALAASEARAVEAHVVSCAHCRKELEMLRPLVDSFAAWPTDVLRPPASLQGRLADRIAAETGDQRVSPPAAQWSEPEWEDVAPGISCKLLATDTEKHMVSMLVRLAPGAHYPPHTHAAVEELHLLEGELWIDERKLHPGDYNRAEPGIEIAEAKRKRGCVAATEPSAPHLCLLPW